MRADHHYDDESLIALLESSDDITRDPHLSACSACSEVAASLREIAGALTHEDVWDTRELDESPDPRTIANLRAFADEMSREDAFAAAHLSALLSGSRETWMANLDAHPELRTAGMVRALIAATDRALDTMPPDGVAMCELATAIADALPPTAYATDTVAKLRGAAWRERAYALFYVGRYTEAESAISTSEKHFSECVVSEYDLGRADIVHALVHRALDRDGEARAVAGEAVARLQPYEDLQRQVSAVTVQAQALMKMFDYSGALALLTDTVAKLGDRLSADTHARMLANIGLCERALGRYSEAIDRYQTAVLIFEDLGVLTEVARNRANIAVVLRDAGRPTEAARETHRAREIFERLGMASDVAVADLVLADIALTAGQFDRVEEFCRRAMEYLTAAGVPYGPRALTALAFVSEAARQRKLTPEVVRHVQGYIRELSGRPTLLYAAPPE